MSPVRDCDYDRMQNVGYGSVHSLFPCVVLPSALAVIALAFAWRSLWNDRQKTDVSISILFGFELLVQTVWGALCVGFCLWFLGENQYMGGEGVCAFQGWFIGFYFFAQPAMLSLLSIASYSWTLRGASLWFAPKVLLILSSFALLFSALLASLPLFGLSHYAMPTNYCTFDLQDGLFAALWLLNFALLCCCLLYGPVRMVFAAAADTSGVSRKLAKASGAVAIHSILAWSVAIVIAIDGLASGSSCQTPPLKETLFGLAAFFAHWQQLASPLLITVWWRRELCANAGNKVQAEVTAADQKYKTEEIPQ
jgi:hypothetical protein